MAKSKNHTAHNQSAKAHKNGIKKPRRHRHTSTKGDGKIWLISTRTEAILSRTDDCKKEDYQISVGPSLFSTLTEATFSLGSIAYVEVEKCDPSSSNSGFSIRGYAQMISPSSTVSKCNVDGSWACDRDSNALGWIPRDGLGLITLLWKQDLKLFNEQCCVPKLWEYIEGIFETFVNDVV
ncbi:unnamed protein product [Arabis nemorensis]|uniref:60S ribosomal protein L29 n=1 Tax=Arabis nemorensis TaxID=586526 RepID=A0A565CP51_9BRAS|nr:unnamed protein product [Arabis nemorensis]